tara:strand:+ start:260 stop:1213 length:954 start_codon:yes stop_codon:yes gene_type:complete
MSKLISELSSATGLSKFDIQLILSNAPKRYKFYTIPKRNGGKRLIAQPSFELKVIQRAFVSVILDELPVHEAATAYEIGTSIKLNAERHVQNGPILKFDFKNFFPSITPKDWKKYCEINNILSDSDVYLSSKLLFHYSKFERRTCLAIGAPSSPKLSNVLMYDFDCRISERVKSDKVTYSRYADDLTFSALRTGFLVNVRSNLNKVIKEIECPQLTINEGKTALITTKYRRQVTGLTLSDQKRVTLGRSRRRLLRSMVHRFYCGQLAAEDIPKLHGWLSFANDVDKSIVEGFARKFGQDIIDRVRDAANKALPEAKP